MMTSSSSRQETRKRRFARQASLTNDDVILRHDDVITRMGCSYARKNDLPVVPLETETGS